MNVEYDYIPKNPVKWIDRLIEVNDGSQFSEDNKKLINAALNKLISQLENKPTS